MLSFAGDFLTADIPDMAEKVAMYKDVIDGAHTIESTLARAQAEFNEYKEYLEQSKSSGGKKLAVGALFINKL